MKIPGLMKEERGLALVPTILLIVLVFAISIATYELATTEAKISLNQHRATEALYLAEAGIQMALHQLERDPNWREGYRNYYLGQGIIKKIDIQNTFYSARIESQAEVQGVGKRVRVDLTKISVPFINPLKTRKLDLRPGAHLAIEGEAVHYGDLQLNGLVQLEGDLIVEGAARLEGAILEGSLTATGPITVQAGSTIKADLVSAQSIHCLGELVEGYNRFPSIPVYIPPVSPTLDVAWYRSRPHFPVEEPILFVNELSSGVYYAPGDLALANNSEFEETYSGRLAVVAEGTVFIASDLIPVEPEVSALIIFAENIDIAEGVGEVWAGLVASETIQFWGSRGSRKIYGTIEAPLVSFPPGSTRLAYYPIPGANLVRFPQTLFQISKWLEIMLL